MSRFVSGRDRRDTNDVLRTTGDTATGAILSPSPTTSTHLTNVAYVNTALSALPLPSNTVNCVFLAGYNGLECSGTWTVPSGVSNIVVQTWGGGAGGAMNCTWRAGAPGGGGGYSQRTIAVTPGQQFCFCAGGGGRGGCSYPGAKRGCPGCNSRFCGPVGAGTVCMIACGAFSTSCAGTFLENACGGRAYGGDINVPGGDGAQFGCCSCRINKQCGPGGYCYSPSLIAGGTFLGAPNQRMFWCSCVPNVCGLPFGGGGFGGISGMYSGGCSCGTSGGPGAVIIWF